MSQPTQTVCLFLGTSDDVSYLSYLKPFFNGLSTYVLTESLETLTHLEMYCKKRGVTRVATTSTTILSKLLDLRGNPKDSPALSDYAGSLFDYKNLEIVFVPPLKQLFSVPYGKFICARYISKIAAPSSWVEATAFSWSLFTPSNSQQIFEELINAYAIAVDIETFKVNLAIRCIGYTGVFIDSAGVITTRSYVLPMDSGWALVWMRKINDLPVQKITQNGKYDVNYLLRYNAPLHSWVS